MDTEIHSNAKNQRGMWGPFLITLLVAGVICACIVGGLVLFFRDPLPLLTQEGLDAAHKRWNEAQIENYNIEIQISGARAALVHVEVRDGKVAVAPMFDGRAVKGRHTWEIWSVAGQFDTLHREIELSENPQEEMEAASDVRILLKASFHKKYGYITKYRRIATGNAPSIAWEIVRFEVLK